MRKQVVIAILLTLALTMPVSVFAQVRTNVVRDIGRTPVANARPVVQLAQVPPQPQLAPPVPGEAMPFPAGAFQPALEGIGTHQHQPGVPCQHCLEAEIGQAHAHNYAADAYGDFNGHPGIMPLPPRTLGNTVRQPPQPHPQPNNHDGRPHDPNLPPCGFCKACLAGEKDKCEILYHKHCPHGVCIYPGKILACDICNPNLPDGVSEWFRAKYPCVRGLYNHPQLGHAPYRAYGDTRGGIPCEICKNALTLQPCGECVACKAGEQCLYAVCRNCIIQNRLNSCNTCDFSLNGQPCGTCDSCRENGLCHEPCGHQRFGIYNPTNEPPLLAATPRFIVSAFNGRGHRLPIYYNPAPHYKNYWNPGSYLAHQRPFQMAYFCPSCNAEDCKCTEPGKAGQVPYYFACKFCMRNPCSCWQEICQANRPLDPVGTTTKLREFYAQQEAAAEAKQNPQVGTKVEEIEGEEDGGEGSLFETDPIQPPVPGNDIDSELFNTPAGGQAAPGKVS